MPQAKALWDPRIVPLWCLNRPMPHDGSAELVGAVAVFCGRLTLLLQHCETQPGKITFERPIPDSTNSELALCYFARNMPTLLGV
jgi:hypothetical protein